MTMNTIDADTYYDTITTLAGPFTFIHTGDTVLASGWTDDLEALRQLIHPLLRPTRLMHQPHPGIARAVTAYDHGDLDAVDKVRVSQQSRTFTMTAWAALRQVPAGRPITYSEFAGRAGRPAAVRAAAAACASNAAALFVPCHRIVRADGGLGGFRYGLAIKQQLLDHEAANHH